MKIAFVGIEKDWAALEKKGYVKNFVKHHLELPHYFASFGRNSVSIVTDYDVYTCSFDGSGIVYTETERSFLKKSGSYDVIVHWRKWFPHLYVKSAINLINSQDHSYSRDWIETVSRAFVQNELDGILCFKTWHERQVRSEFERFGCVCPQLITDCTLGVDIETYRPLKKNMHDMLWASDPGRGLIGAMEIAVRLFATDNRFRLHICWPDYHSGKIDISHPAFMMHNNLDNGKELWDLFNSCAYLPYTSTFMEPSSRCHRQAMAAGCVVLYPPNMGSPSELITDGVDGIVSDPSEWPLTILKMSNERFETISSNARLLAENEDWEVQALRFNAIIGEMVKDGHKR